MSQPAFDAYATPPSNALYSAKFFRALTFGETADVEAEYPTLASAGSLHSWVFDRMVPDSELASKVLPGEVIPCLADLVPIMAKLEGAFGDGFRSLVAAFCIDGVERTVVYHFRKIRLFINVNNNLKPVQLSKALFEHVGDAELLSPALRQRLRNIPIHTPISGFTTASFSLWELGYLRGEEWLEEDVVNGLCELMYFRNIVESVARGVNESRAVILPTLLYSEAVYLMGDSTALNSEGPSSFPLSPNLVAVRERIRASHPESVYLLICNGSHYSVATYRSADGALEYRDSLGNAPPATIYPIFSTLLEGLDLPMPSSPRQIKTIPVPLQLSAHGSCGVATVNFIEHDLDPTNSKRWSTSARLESVPNGNCKSVVSVGPLGYNDFNLRYPLSEHPIWNFAKAVATEPYAELRFYPGDGLRLPSVSQPRSWLSVPPPSPAMKVKQEHPISQSAPSTPSAARPFAPKPTSEPKPKHIDHGIPAPALIKSESKPEVIDHTPSSIEFKPKSEAADLDTLAPLVPPKAESTTIPLTVKHEVIDLTLSSPVKVSKKEESDMLGDFRRWNSHYKVNMQADASTHTVRVVIDLCTPTPSPSPPPPPPSSNVPPTVIDLSTPSPPASPHLPSPSSNPHPPQRPEPQHDIKPLPLIQIGTVFQSLEEARASIEGVQEKLGFRWRTAQSKTSAGGAKRKVTYRCRQYYHHTPTHSPYIDPAEHRESKTVKCGCNARVNVNRISGTSLWNVTLVDFEHNHERELAEGGVGPPRPTEDQKQMISQLVTASHTNFNRKQLGTILNTTLPTRAPLEARQISNIMNAAQREARREVEALGGDISSVLASLQEKKNANPNWSFDVLLDEDQRLSALWWCDPVQAELLRRFPDLLLNDNTYNRNQYGYPLNIGIGIDNFGHSRNVWYCFQELEDTETHNWVLRKHLENAGRAPEVFFSDRHQSLIRSVVVTMPTSQHIFCLHHLEGNITTNLRPVLGPQWDPFKAEFWVVYRSPSPSAFDVAWNALMDRYPRAREYMADVYECRSQWGWAWLSTMFTAGIRTNGRVESENRVNKELGGPKKSLLQVFRALCERTSQQTVQEMAEVRQTAQRQNDRQVEGVFRPVLDLARAHAGPFALQVIYKQMQASVYYRTEVVQLPHGAKAWAGTMLPSSSERGFEWAGGEETKMTNDFKNDAAHISINWLLDLINSRGLVATHVLKITHLATHVSHYLVVLSKDRYICDCTMGLNLGIPCRHYLQAWTTFKGLPFHIGLVRRRWYKDPTLDTETTASVAFSHAGAAPADNTSTVTLPTVLLANPLERSSIHTIPPPSTQTINAREVNHEAQAVLRPMLESVRTIGDLDDVLTDLRALKRARIEAQSEGGVRDPPVLNPKGRPRVARITGRVEGGKPRGGGPPPTPGRVSRNAAAEQQSDAPQAPLDAQTQQQPAPATGGTQRRCGLCREVGHNRNGCPFKGNLA
ncbi:hypothetical protein D9611_013180 [Ephemerocybe angulata]|uniref:SWIM-type domain-containing protein n=1 Tax=Ephemerocybe angulata TaxID=980116 RepID=A0A8H5BT97_9AGAR|nr:hypothetical protein D9611_013180 [Tulosesus angulatus]